MANLSQFVFYDITSTERTSNVFGNINDGSALNIQVDDFGGGLDFNLVIEGSTDMTSDSFYPLKVISLENFKTTKTIKTAGIYMAIIDGVSRVRIKSNKEVGGFKVFAVSVT